MVDDVNKTVDYYCRVLGFEVIMTVPESGEYKWAMLKSDAVMLMFQHRDSLLEEYSVLANSTMGGSLSLFISTSEINELYNKLIGNKDVKFLKKLGKTFYGKLEFAIQDINNYVLTFSGDPVE